MATYWVDLSAGNNGNAGTSEGAAWLTLAYAATQAGAGDEVRVKGSSVALETLPIQTAGTATAPTLWIGYGSTFGDNGKVTIDGASTRASGITDSISGSGYHVFRNFIIQNHTSHGIDISIRDVIFVNCEIKNNGGRGANCNYAVSFVNCIITGNTLHGIVHYAGTVVGCDVSSNGQRGCWNANADGFYVGNTWFSNGLEAMYLTNGALGVICAAFNTVDGDGEDTTAGIEIVSGAAGHFVLLNNILYDCGVGIDNQSTLDAGMIWADYNLLNGNSTDLNSVNAGDNDVSGAPDFRDEAGNDYRLNPASPAVRAALGHGDNSIGAAGNPRVFGPVMPARVGH